MYENKYMVLVLKSIDEAVLIRVQGFLLHDINWIDYILGKKNGSSKRLMHAVEEIICEPCKVVNMRTTYLSTVRQYLYRDCAKSNTLLMDRMLLVGMKAPNSDLYYCSKPSTKTPEIVSLKSP